MPTCEMPLTLVFRVFAFSALFVVLGFWATVSYHWRLVRWLSTYYELHCVKVTVMVFRGKLKFVWVDLMRDPFLLYFIINFIPRTAILSRLSEPDILN